jgi:hypothetical protein
METMSTELKRKWKNLYAQLSADPRFSSRLAGLFLGHVPESYHAGTLYIGKATRGHCESNNPGAAYFNKKGAFWSFARRLSRSVDPRCGDDLPNLAWTNICKIGTISGNPNKELAKAQRPLAIATLIMEIRTLNPTLVVFVTDGYLDCIVNEVLNVEHGANDEFEYQLSGDIWVYYRCAQDGWPPILWMKHPQGKKRRYLEDAEQIARDLMVSH